MRRPRQRPRRTLVERTGPCLGAIAVVTISGCMADDPPAVTQEVGTPPSIAAEAPETGGAVVRRVRLSEGQAAGLAIRTVEVAREPVVFDIAIPGTVGPAPNYYAEVSSPLAGRIASMSVQEGDPVRAGQVMAELESIDMANLVAEYREALAERDLATTQVDRYELLVERKISPASALERAYADLARAEARSGAAEVRLRSLGVEDSDLEQWYSGAVTSPVLHIRSPIDGVVSDHGIELGQPVSAYESMMSVLDASRVRIQGFLDPGDAAFVRPGDAVFVSTPGAGTSVESRVTSLSPSLTTANRSVVLNAPLDAVNGWPIPGQSVRLTVRVAPGEPLMSLPLSAVEYEGESAVVFVRGEDDRTWTGRPIEVARMNDDQIIVAAGLEPGEIVAVSQVFTLKAMARFEDFGEEP